MGSHGLISRPVSRWDKARFRLKETDERQLRTVKCLNRIDSRISVGVVGDEATRRADARALDREPGELSNYSGSDGDFESEINIRKRDTGISVYGDRKSKLENKRRKFSAVVNDKADKADASRISQSTDAITQIILPFPVKIDVAAAAFSHVSAASHSPSTVSPLATVEDDLYVAPMANSPGTAVQADDEDMSLPSISACRWANDSESPAHGGIFDNGEIPKLTRKKPENFSGEELQKVNRRRSVTNYSETNGQRKPVTPEYGGFYGNMVRSSDERSRPSSSCTYQEENDMDIYLDSEVGPISTYFETGLDDNCTPHESPDHVTPPPRTLNMLQSCRCVDEFERLSKINEGTYGVVYRAKDKKTGEIVALKKVKMEKEREGFPLTALREINILLAFHHPSVVGVKEVVVGSDIDSIYMSMEYMDHDLRELMNTMKQPFSQSEVKCLMLQLLEGVKYLHDNWVLHRDLKTSNLLLNNHGELKICDFGLARQYGSPLKPYTALVVTLWYRAPELLLGAKEYSTAIDMWSVGCIMAELLSKKPIFNGKTEVDQLDKIFRLLGTPNENIWPGCSKLPGVKAKFVNHRCNLLRQKFPATSFSGSPVLSDAGFCLLNSLLTYDPKQRITVDDALKHDWFQEVPLPKEKEHMPSYPSKHAEDRRFMSGAMNYADILEDLYAKELTKPELRSVKEAVDILLCEYHSCCFLAGTLIQILCEALVLDKILLIRLVWQDTGVIVDDCLSFSLMESLTEIIAVLKLSGKCELVISLGFCDIYLQISLQHNSKQVGESFCTAWYYFLLFCFSVKGTYDFCSYFSAGERQMARLVQSLYLSCSLPQAGWSYYYNVYII